MCNLCEPNGWTKKRCNICGEGPVTISISMAVPGGDDYPFSTTDLCASCWATYGIDAAVEHNKDCRELASSEH